MGNTKKRKRGSRAKKRVLQHKLSVLGISGVIVMLAAILSVGSISLRKKNEAYKAQEAELTAQLEEQAERSEEIDELDEYVGTDEYVEDVAKDKLGLINPNEILFRAEP
ncbi:MAG: septum formation initiator family protein [Faecalimonas sp.]|nr:septum formation initiator family protein [Faecalimonas sp.]